MRLWPALCVFVYVSFLPLLASLTMHVLVLVSFSVCLLLVSCLLQSLFWYFFVTFLYNFGRLLCVILVSFWGHFGVMLGSFWRLFDVSERILF